MAKQADALILERMQTKMRFLEDSNTVMQTRNQNLIAENKVLTSQLEDERSDVKILGKRVESLRVELESEKSRVAEMKKAAMQRKNMPQVEANGTSTTNIVPRTDRGVQIWAVCMGCQRKLESCEKQPPTVVITKSELELLEKDMQTLRDTIIAREEAWDKAMEREQNYRQQLTRLTTETITARHLSETRHEELEALSRTLLEKESELKSHQKDNQCLNKLIAKLYNGHQSCRGQDESKKSSVLVDINEKDQKFIEEIVRRVSSAKSKQKPKAKSARSEKNANCSAYQTSSRDKSARPAKDQTGLSRDAKR
ncbi:uncharacterized protein LOC143378435 [Andrena cerasifolii]|uniref:uncharacterized protein LOC143378435 n=1 Tax=Andrena cerasifolii TaxID=2819439 RepID=UPI004037A23F